MNLEAIHYDSDGRKEMRQVWKLKVIGQLKVWNKNVDYYLGKDIVTTVNSVPGTV